MVKIMSTCDGRAAGEPAQLAPPATKDSAFSRVRLKTTREWPHFCRLAAMRLPIIPRPMKPIFIFSPVSFFREPCSRRREEADLLPRSRPLSASLRRRLRILSREFGDSFDLFKVRVRQTNRRRGDHVVHLLRLACANDRSRNGRVAQRPGNSDCTGETVVA